ncbi:MAG: hypothetical protein WC314_10945 [Vulcanimicrobiota bacterium]
MERLAERLEEELQHRGELILSSMEWGLDAPSQDYDPTDPYTGLTPQFLAIVKELYGTPAGWLNAYLALLTVLSTGGELSERFVAMSDRLWMNTLYRGRAIWYTAFPPLDGGGSSQARVFHQYLLRQDRCFETCFEWCSGPGFLGFSTLWSGMCKELVLADINPAVVPGILRTIEENALQGKVRYYISDNLQSVPAAERFDLVLGNPPWAYREIPELPNPLIPNDPEWNIHRSFFRQLGPYLNPNACVCISAYQPFRTVAHIEYQEEPWDVRPRPPIQDFREFLAESGLSIQEVHRPPADPQVAYGQGLTLLLISAEEDPLTRPDLIGLGGAREPLVGGFEFDLSVVQRLPLEQMVQHTVQVEALRVGIHQNLQDRHLTRVLRDLFGQTRKLEPSTLQALNLSPEIVEAFPDWGVPENFQYRPPLEGLHLAPESCRHPCSVLRLQLGQDAPVSIGLRILRALLQALPPSISFCILVKPGFDEKSTRNFLSRFPGYARDRISFFPHGHQTLFAQDNGRLATAPGGTRVLLTPGHLSAHRPGDALLTGPLPLIRSRLHWEGGNLLCDGHFVFVGANAVAANMRGLGLTEAQVVSAFACEMGYPVQVLGDVSAARNAILKGERGLAVAHAVDGGQADFHIDLDCCLLGEDEKKQPRVALADPELGLDYLHSLLGLDHLFEGHSLDPTSARTLFRRSLEDSVARRTPLLAQYAEVFEKAGYRVVRIPDIRLVSDFNYLARVNTTFSYCNALPLSLEGRPTVALLACGFPHLEAEVERIYADLGVDVLKLGDRTMAEDLLSMRGGLHCFCSAMG